MRYEKTLNPLGLLILVCLSILGACAERKRGTGFQPTGTHQKVLPVIFLNHDRYNNRIAVKVGYSSPSDPSQILEMPNPPAARFGFRFLKIEPFFIETASTGKFWTQQSPALGIGNKGPIALLNSQGVEFLTVPFLDAPGVSTRFPADSESKGPLEWAWSINVESGAVSSELGLLDESVSIHYLQVLDGKFLEKIFKVDPRQNPNPLQTLPLNELQDLGDPLALRYKGCHSRVYFTNNSPDFPNGVRIEQESCGVLRRLNPTPIDSK